jgi:integrase/recombinase XerD
MTNQQKEDIKNKFRDKLLYVNYSSNTIETYLRYINTFLTWLPIDLEQLTPTHLTEFMSTLEGYSPSTKNNIMHAYLPSFFNFLVNIGTIKQNIFSLMKIPTVKKEHKEVTILSTDELKLMVENPAGRPTQIFRNKVLLKLLTSTGIRISEALSLRPIDIKESKVMIHGKGAKERLIDITPHTKQLLHEYLKSLGLEKDKPMFDLTRQWALDIVLDTAKKNSIDKHITPHTFRHSFATLWCKVGKNESALRKYMGWQKNFDVSIYVDLANQDISGQYNEVAGELE